MDLYDLCVWFNVFYHFCCNTVSLCEYVLPCFGSFPNITHVGKLKKAYLLWWKALDVSEENFWSFSSRSTCEYTRVFLGWEQSSIHCFLPALYGKLSRRPIFNQLSDKTCFKRRAKRRSCHCSSCVASIWYPQNTEMEEWPRLSKADRNKGDSLKIQKWHF